MEILFSHIWFRRPDEALRLLEWHTPEDRQYVIDLIRHTPFDGLNSLHMCVIRNYIQVFQAIIDVFGDDRLALIDLILQEDNNGHICLHLCGFDDSVEIFRIIMNIFRDDRPTFIRLLQHKEEFSFVDMCEAFGSVNIFCIIMYEYDDCEEVKNMIQSSYRIRNLYDSTRRP
jgi:hypothetical protein